MQPEPTSTSPVMATDPDAAARGSLWGGVLTGLVPLAPVAAIIIIALALATLVRLLASGLGFAVQQWSAVIIIGLGLVGAAASYIIFSRRALRRVKRWQEAGQTAQATGALWGLVVVALMILLPLALAFIMPQHPAPNLAP